MKKSILLLMSMCFFSLLVHSQIHILKNEIIPLDIKQSAFYPKINESGTQLLFTDENHRGLILYDIQNQQQLQISQELGSGYDPSFGKGDHTIYYKEDQIKEGKRYKILMYFDQKGKITAPISAPLRNMKDLKRAKRVFEKTNESLSISIENLKLILYHNSVPKQLNPLPEKSGFIWASLSPNQKMILFTAATKGTFICDLSGNILYTIGNLNAPVWFGNDYVVGMKDLDNGEQIQSSSIWIQSLNGRIQKKLTSEDEIAMYPSVSEQTCKIAYNTYDGKIRIITLSFD